MIHGRDTSHYEAKESSPTDDKSRPEIPHSLPHSGIWICSPLYRNYNGASRHRPIERYSSKTRLIALTKLRVIAPYNFWPSLQVGVVEKLFVVKDSFVVNLCFLSGWFSAFPSSRPPSAECLDSVVDLTTYDMSCPEKKLGQRSLKSGSLATLNGLHTWVQRIFLWSWPKNRLQSRSLSTPDNMALSGSLRDIYTCGQSPCTEDDGTTAGQFFQNAHIHESNL